MRKHRFSSFRVFSRFWHGLLTIGGYMSFSVIEVESTWNGNDVLCVHVVPNYDELRAAGIACPDHNLVGDHCACSPKVEYMDNGNALIVHKALFLVGADDAAMKEEK